MSSLYVVEEIQMKKKTTAKVNATKAVAKTPEVKPVEVKPVEVKAEEKATAKVEDVKAVATEAVAEKKETKATKTTKSTKTTAKKAVKEELKPEVFIQYQGQEAVVADAIEKAKAEFVADGHRVSSIKSLQVYLKPEEYAAYYVINQKFAGRVDLF